MTNTQARKFLSVLFSINEAKAKLQKLADSVDHSDTLSDVDSMWYALDDVCNDYSHRFDEAHEKRKKKK